ncbi:MAG: hypothetical protein AAB473_01080 [Patescibacteria group bacterium]
MATTTFRIIAGPSKSDLIGDLFFFQGHTHHFTLMMENPPATCPRSKKQIVSAAILSISGGQYAPLEIYRIEIRTGDGMRLQGHYSTKTRDGALALVEETKAWIVECGRNWVTVSEEMADKFGFVSLYRGNNPAPFRVKVGGGPTDLRGDSYAFACASEAEARSCEEDHRRSYRGEPQR